MEGGAPRDDATDDGVGVVNRVGVARGRVVQAGVIRGSVHFHAEGASRPQPVAKPISAWTARDLGVHASIVVGDEELADPPRYVVRRHDEVVRGLVGRRAAESLMVVLVGGSAVGKTRTAYEALLACDQVRSWPVIVPDGPAQLRDVLANGVPARHVLWLNDVSSRFLESHHGADLAEGLASALRAGGPVLILADLWTSHLRALTDDRPTAASSAQVKHLLNLPQVELVAVPDDFAEANDAEQARLRDCARQDERLALAVNLAHAEKKITQLLAGGPQVLRHYTEGGYTDQARALITAALDIACLGSWAPADIEVLRRATAEYLDPSQRVVAGDWFVAALENAAQRRHGIAALTPIRVKPGMGTADSCVLHDYLFQETSKPRHRTRPPAGLWAALAERPPGAEDCGRLAAAAVNRGLYRLAAHFALLAAEADDPNAMKLLASLCEFRGAAEQAQAWQERAAPGMGARWANVGDLLVFLHEDTSVGSDHTPVGDPADQAVFLADALRREGRRDEAEALLRPHAEAKHPAAMWSLFLLLDHRDRDEECLALLRELTDMGDPIALWYVVKRLGDNGADQEAEQLLRVHAGHGGDGAPGDPSAMWCLAGWLVRHNQIPEAVHWYALSAEHSLQGANLLVETFGELGCLEAAERPLRAQAAKAGGLASTKLAQLLGLLGRHDEAVAVLRESLEETDWHPLPGRISAPPTMSRLADALRHAGQAHEAAQVQAYGIEPGGATAQPWELPATR